MIFCCLCRVTEAGAPPNRVPPRCRTSITASTSPSRATRSSSPALQRRLRARMSTPCVCRYSTASCSDACPWLVMGPNRAPENRAGRRRWARNRADMAANFARIPSMPPHHHTTDGFRNNYIDSVTKSLGDLLRWQWQRIRDHLPPSPADATSGCRSWLHPPQRPAGAHGPGRDLGRSRDRAGAGGGLNVLTDRSFPCAPRRCAGPKRVQAPGVAPKSATRCGAISLSLRSSRPRRGRRWHGKRAGAALPRALGAEAVDGQPASPRPWNSTGGSPCMGRGI